MQYLRMLTNSLLAGALVGAYVALLVLQLNPLVRLDSMAAARLILTWAAFYGVHAAAFFYALIVLRQLFAVEVRTPGWISLRILAAFCTIAVSMSAIVTWLNLHGFRSVLGPDAAARMTDGALVVSLCAAVCTALPWCRLACIEARGIVATVFGLVLVASLAWPLYLRGAGDPTPPPRTPVGCPAGARTVECARAHDSARRRVARFHRAECGGRALSEFRAAARQRRGDAPRDASADAARARVDRRGHGEAALQDQRLFGRALRGAWFGSTARFAARLLLRAGARAARTDRRGGPRVRCRSRASDLGAAERLRHHGGRHRLAAHVSGARRQRLSGQRRVSPSRSRIGRSRRSASRRSRIRPSR